MKPNENREVLMRKGQIEGKLVELLMEVKSGFNVEDIKDVIYHEDGFAAHVFAKILPMFDTGFGNADINELTSLLMDAWNYFPHDSLDGLSPAEISSEHKSKNKKPPGF